MSSSAAAQYEFDERKDEHDDQHELNARANPALSTTINNNTTMANEGPAKDPILRHRGM